MGPTPLAQGPHTPENSKEVSILGKVFSVYKMVLLSLGSGIRVFGVQALFIILMAPKKKAVTGEINLFLIRHLTQIINILLK